jgi:hypothetical protein
VEQLIFLALAILYGLGVGIYRFVKWVNRLAAGTKSAPNPVQQAINDAQRQTRTKRAPSQTPARPMPRQPQAGGPAVPWETTERDFRRQEQELFGEEPPPLASPLQSAAVTPPPSAPPLFSSTEDWVRAIILQEVLGPPLSRRNIRAQMGDS